MNFENLFIVLQYFFFSFSYICFECFSNNFNCWWWKLWILFCVACFMIFIKRLSIYFFRIHKFISINIEQAWIVDNTKCRYVFNISCFFVFIQCSLIHFFRLDQFVLINIKIVQIIDDVEYRYVFNISCFFVFIQCSSIHFFRFDQFVLINKKKLKLIKNIIVFRIIHYFFVFKMMKLSYTTFNMWNQTSLQKSIFSFNIIEHDKIND